MSPGERPTGSNLPAERIGGSERRKVRARRRGEETAWFGLGMFGLVGWAVSVPMLAGLAAGIALDTNFPGPRSWTLMLLLAGVALGCLNAWYWVRRQHRHILEGRGDNGEGRP